MSDVQVEIDSVVERLALYSEEQFWGSLDIAVGVQLDRVTRVERASLEMSGSANPTLAGTAGVWMIRGVTTDGESFTQVLKGLWRNLDAPHADLWGTTAYRHKEPFHWRREYYAYQSKLLSRPGMYGLRWADYHGSLGSPRQEQLHRQGIFLEAVQGIPGRDLSDTDFELVARRLGAVQGHFFLRHVARTGLNEPWLAENYEAEYIRRVGTMMETPANRQAWAEFEAGRLPVMAPFREAYDNGKTLAQAVNELWDARGEFLDIVHSLPSLTLSHNDLWYGQVNLAQDGTVVLDLAALGRSPLGADLGKLAVELGARDFLSLAALPRLEKKLLDAYLLGLTDAGVRVDDQMIKLVELGWCAAVAAGESYRPKVDWAPVAAEESRSQVVKLQWNGRTPEQIFGVYADRSRRLLQLSKRARDLADDLRPLLTGEQRLSLATVATPRGRSAALAARPVPAPQLDTPDASAARRAAAADRAASRGVQPG